MTGNLIVGKNVIVWTLDGTKLDKIPLINPQTVASITRWDNGKEVRYVPGGKNPANFTNLVKNVIYLFEVKQSFQLPSATLILSVAAPTPAPTPASTPAPAPTPGVTIPTFARNVMSYLKEKSFTVGNNVSLHFCNPPGFANAFKTARREWVKATWDGNNYNFLNGETVPLDEKGNPLGDGYNVVWEGTGNNQGTYLLQFEGKARVIDQFRYFSFPDFGNSNMVLPGQGYDAATNTTTIKAVMTSSESQNLTLIFVETQSTNNSAKGTGLKNLRLIRPVAPGSSTPHSPTEVFNRPYLNAFAAFDHIRFMAGTNWNQQVNWSDRTHPWENQTKFLENESGFERNGAALEYQILLCNQTGKDFWLNIPHKATDDWIQNAALVILYGSDGTNPYTSPQANPVYPPLDPKLKCYIEYTNEWWNWAYQQCHDLVAICKQQIAAGNSPLNYDGQTADLVLNSRYAMMRTVTASRIFRKLAGDGAMGTRIRPCFFFQYKNDNDTASGGLNFLLDYYGDVGDIWGVGGATYFQSNNDSAGSVDGIFASGMPKPENIVYIQVESYWAHLLGLNYCAYEGGFGVGGDSKGAAQNDSYWDPRAKVAQRFSLDTFAANDGFLYTCGTYAVYKSIYEVDASPLVAAVKEFKAAAANPPVLAMPKVANIPGTVPADEGGDGIARYYRNGSRLNRLLVAPANGNYLLSLNYSGTDASIQVFVNGFPVPLTSLPAVSGATNSQTVPITLRKGVNGLIVQVKKGNMTFYKINVTK